MVCALSWQEAQGIFSDIRYEDLVGLQEVKLSEVRAPAHDWVTDLSLPSLWILCLPNPGALVSY